MMAAIRALLLSALPSPRSDDLQTEWEKCEQSGERNVKIELELELELELHLATVFPTLTV